MQVLGFAGDLTLAAEPHYATIYRLKPDGEIVSAVFKIIDGSKLTEAVNTFILSWEYHGKNFQSTKKSRKTKTS